MQIEKARNLVCPIDEKRLVLKQKQLVCENGHAFDIARQGYVNLLPVQHKRSKQPGDSKDMVLARTRFLNSGYYEPLAARLAELVSLQIPGTGHTCLLDAGCGEGYYPDFLLNALKARPGNGELSFIGLDISKDAIVQAAKRSRQITWLVGTNRQPPVEQASLDIILCVFGFHNFEAFASKLRPGGKVILVDPGVEHLQELREIIYTEVKQTDPREIPHAAEGGFRLQDRQVIQFKTGEIDHTGVLDLLMMTPHFYRATKAGREAAGKLQKLDLTVDVVFRVLEKK